MSKQKENLVQEWIGNGFKSLVFCVFTMFTYFVHQFNNNVEAMTQQLKVMEQHQVEADKRIAAIEVSREVNSSSYQRVVQDVAEMKTTLTQLSMRTQTISDFVAKHFK